MADKNITFRQKNTSGVYDKLYTKTTATQSKLSTETAALFGDGTSDADAALAKIADTIKSIGNVQVKVVDPNGNPIQGARITGLYGTPTTASDRTAHGVLQTNPISISSPYIDLKDQTADASGYAGSFDVLVVTLPIVGENSITRITSSGGQTYYYESGGGGGGAIVNSYGKSINADTNYVLSVGSGGASGYTGGTGGTTTFLSVNANGGGGAYVYQPSSSSSPIGKGGSAGSPGSGKGGDYGLNRNGENSTITEFDDGVTFYSGGGGSGGAKGGTPNGADGAYITGGYPHTSYPHSATTPGIGGGGGGATYDQQIQADLPSAGGPGLVAIRFHF